MSSALRAEQFPHRGAGDDHPVHCAFQGDRERQRRDGRMESPSRASGTCLYQSTRLASWESGKLSARFQAADPLTAADHLQGSSSHRRIEKRVRRPSYVVGSNELSRWRVGARPSLRGGTRETRKTEIIRRVLSHIWQVRHKRRSDCIPSIQIDGRHRTSQWQ